MQITFEGKTIMKRIERICVNVIYESEKLWKCLRVFMKKMFKIILRRLNLSSNKTAFVNTRLVLR